MPGPMGGPMRGPSTTEKPKDFKKTTKKLINSYFIFTPLKKLLLFIKSFISNPIHTHSKIIIKNIFPKSLLIIWAENVLYCSLLLFYLTSLFR